MVDPQRSQAMKGNKNAAKANRKQESDAGNRVLKTVGMGAKVGGIFGKRGASIGAAVATSAIVGGHRIQNGVTKAMSRVSNRLESHSLYYSRKAKNTVDDAVDAMNSFKTRVTKKLGSGKATKPVGLKAASSPGNAKINAAVVKHANTRTDPSGFTMADALNPKSKGSKTAQQGLLAHDKAMSAFLHPIGETWAEQKAYAKKLMGKQKK